MTATTSVPTQLTNTESDALSTIQAWVYQNAFDPDNVASAASTVTVNGYSGTATFTAGLTAGTATEFIVNNSTITADSIVEYGLIYLVVAGEAPQITSYFCAGGSLSFFVSNPGTDPATTISIWFQIKSA